MKITDEIVELADDAYDAQAESMEDVQACSIRCLRRALEAALADVPEPCTGGLSGPEALRLRTGYERLKRRAEAAEAKLTKVREWAKSPTANNERYDSGTEILQILDEE